MAVELDVGFSCRDLAELPVEEAELRAFCTAVVGGAIYNEVIAHRRVMDGGLGGVFRDAFDPELQTRGCSIDGRLRITF